jgi:hypothetical protein
VTEDRGRERVTFLGREVPPPFEMQTIGVLPGGVRAYEEAEWRGALVVVERGVIELEGIRGGRRRFEAGAVLWLSGLPLRALHNSGSEPAVLVAVTRRPSTVRSRASPP